MRLPNFLLIGVTKAGTSSMYEYLRQHPQIYMPDLKEPRFFSYDPCRATPKSKNTVRTIEQYAALFARVKGEIAVGEASPHYFTSRRATARIMEVLTDPRMIISFRNPADRFHSLHGMSVRQGREPRSLTTVLQEDIHRLHFLKYSPHLKRYLDSFDRSLFHFLKFEDFCANAELEMSRIFQFLRVSTDFVPDVSKIANKGGAPRIGFLERLIASRRLRIALSNWTPDLLKGPVRTLRRANLASAAPLDAHTRRRLQDFFESDTEELQRLTGLDLTSWNTD